MGQASIRPDYRPLLVKDKCLWERPVAVGAAYPHVVLPISGLHSSGYVRAPVDNPELMQTIAYELYDQLVGAAVSCKIDLVVGPERETALLVGLFTLRLQALRHVDQQGVRTCVTKKLRAGTPEEDQEWVEHYTNLADGSRVLVLENVVTTGITATQTVHAIRRYAKRAGVTVEVLPVIGCIVNRTSKDTLSIDGKEFKLVAYLHKQFPEWPPDDCPLCLGGSPALDPRTKWEVLMKPS